MEVRDAIAASPGIAIAPAFPMESEEFVVSARPVEAAAVEDEVHRFEEAVATAVVELGDLRRSTELPPELGQLFEALLNIIFRGRRSKSLSFFLFASCTFFIQINSPRSFIFNELLQALGS